MDKLSLIDGVADTEENILHDHIHIVKIDISISVLKFNCQALNITSMEILKLSFIKILLTSLIKDFKLQRGADSVKTLFRVNIQDEVLRLYLLEWTIRKEKHGIVS